MFLLDYLASIIYVSKGDAAGPVSVERHDLIPEEIWEKLKNMVKRFKARDGKESKKWESAASGTTSSQESNPQDMQIPDKKVDCLSVKTTHQSPEIKSQDLDKACSSVDPQPGTSESNFPVIKEARQCVEFDVRNKYCSWAVEVIFVVLQSIILV